MQKRHKDQRDNGIVRNLPRLLALLNGDSVDEVAAHHKLSRSAITRAVSRLGSYLYMFEEVEQRKQATFKLATYNQFMKDNGHGSIKKMRNNNVFWLSLIQKHFDPLLQ